jgi:hypothetical protein
MNKKMKSCDECRHHSGTKLTSQMCWKDCAFHISLVDGNACTGDIPHECNWFRSERFGNNACGPEAKFWIAIGDQK